MLHLGPAGNISNQMRTATNQVHDQTSVAALEYIANRKKKLEVPERPLPPINPDKSAEDSDDDDEEEEDSTDLDYQPPSASKLIVSIYIFNSIWKLHRLQFFSV